MSVETQPAAPPTFTVRPGEPADDPERDRFVLEHPRGTFFHRSGWRRVVEKVFGHEPSDWIAVADGRIVGVLPMMRTRSLSQDTQLISMPYAVYGGALGIDPSIESALVAAAVAEGQRERVGRVELRYFDEPELGALPDKAGRHGVERYGLYSTFVRELPDRVEDVLAQIPKKARAECRKARDKHGLELTEGTWYLGDLHRLFLNNKRSLGSPALPLRWFKALCEEFGKDCVVHLVHRGKEPLAAVMSFVQDDTLLAYYAGTADGADRNYSASNFMYMALQEWSVARGLKRFDFGRSRRDSGAFSFKEHQGFVARELPYRIVRVRDAALPSFNPSNPNTAKLRKAWSAMPRWLAERLSDPLSRYLP